MNESPPAVSTACGQADPLALRYEELRQQAFRGTAAGFGYALLLHQGLRACIEAWSRCMPEPARPVEPFPGHSVLPLPVRGEVVALLANLALGARA